MLKHLLIIFFLLFSVACQNNDNATFKKWENRDIDGLKMIDTFNKNNLYLFITQLLQSRYISSHGREKQLLVQSITESEYIDSPD